MKQHLRARTGVNLLLIALTSPWIWGGLATWGFYKLIPVSPLGKEFLTRYCCSHPLEYIETTLFFVGMAIIVAKAIALIPERRAFKSILALGPNPAISDFPKAIANLENEVAEVELTLADTYWGRRLDHLLAFGRGRKTPEGLSSHLTYLTEAEADRLHSSHALLQTIIWSIPILGFLGTVMGITLAIANVTPEQLESSLNDVTGGLAVAFDTTAIALTFSLVMGFGSLFVKRSEERLLVDIDERCRLESNRCFAEVSSSGHPLLKAEEEAAQLLIRQTSSVMDRQMGLWNNAIGALSTQWAETLAAQQSNLSETLNQGTQLTLAHHAAQLAESREQILNSQEEISRRLLGDLDQLLEKRQAADSTLVESLNRVAEQISVSAERQIQTQTAEVDRLLAGFAAQSEEFETRSRSWQSQMSQLVETLSEQAETLREHGAQLERIGNQEDSLLRLQDHLNQNLASIRNAEGFDETLHNLNAAVHLLTARVRNREAA